MLLKRDANIRCRSATFEGNLQRALNIEVHASSMLHGSTKTEQPLISDLHRSAIVFAVGAVDELCKGLFFEVLSGYLLGDLQVPNAPRAAIPATVARLFIDGHTASLSVNHQFDALAVSKLQEHIERDNFQSFESIAKRYSECGLGKLKYAFSDPEVLESFKQSLGTLAEVRHSAVHRVGLIDNNTHTSNDNLVVANVMARFSEHISNLRNGGASITASILSRVSSPL